MKRTGRLLITALLSALLAPVSSLADGGYLFVTFTGERTPMSEQVYFATSTDGRKWTGLNGGKPVLVSNVGEKGVRDPYIIRSPDGKKAYMIATDLSMHLNPNWGRAARQGSQSIVVWESDDLVTWSEPRLVKVAPDDAGCTWAPEAIFDPETQDFLVFWASTNASDEHRKFRMWAARTKDFKEFSKPFVYIEDEFPIIDTTIIRDGDKYYRFNKNERKRAITLESADKLAGPWTLIPEFTLANLQGYEGPAVFQLNSPDGTPGKWCLLLDYYSRGQGYKPFIATDLAKGHFEPAPNFEFPFLFRHGTVLPISQEELDRLNSKLTPLVLPKTPAPSTRPSTTP